MQTSPTTRHLAVVGRSTAGQPRTFRLERGGPVGHRDAAYRRLAAVILGLDVANLATELRAARLRQSWSMTPPRAA
jgi:hypothetical protein